MSRLTGPRWPAALGLRSAWLSAAPLLLAGLLPLDDAVTDRWCWSGAWTYPVGDPFDFTRPGPEGAPPYQANRVLLGDGGGRHAGADLSNRQGGGTVRAAANGIVVSVAIGARYGEHVVLAHRLADGSAAYSVYAHLESGSSEVRAGEPVACGAVLGRVGDTGRATSPHLHFEVRSGAAPEQRWENAPVRHPLDFVRARLPVARADTTWARPYLVWAEGAGLIAPGAPADRAISRAEWWRALAAAMTHCQAPLDAPPETLRVALRARGIEPRGAPGYTPAWPELVRELRRAREDGLRLPSAALDPEARADDSRRVLGAAAPAGDLDALAARAGDPTVAALCLLLADLAWAPAGPPTAERARR